MKKNVGELNKKFDLCLTESIHHKWYLKEFYRNIRELRGIMGILFRYNNWLALQLKMNWTIFIKKYHFVERKKGPSEYLMAYSIIFNGEIVWWEKEVLMENFIHCWWMRTSFSGLKTLIFVKNKVRVLWEI